MGQEPLRSLAGRYYTDPEIFQKEKTGLFAKSWQFACHASTPCFSISKTCGSV